MKKLLLLGNALLAANTFSTAAKEDNSKEGKEFSVLSASYNYFKTGDENDEKFLDKAKSGNDKNDNMKINVSYIGKFNTNYDRENNNDLGDLISNPISDNDMNNNPITSPNTTISNNIENNPAPPVNVTVNFQQSTIIASYKYPNANSPYWNQITAMGGSKIPYVIINPSSGPGSSANSDYTRQIQININAGIKNIGYVKTDYFNRSDTDIFFDVDRYVQLYGRENISGIFFDEAVPGSNQTEINKMRELYNYMKTRYPEMTIMANPGRNISDGISPYADIWVTSETNADRYINRFYQPTSIFENTASNSKNIMHIIYAATPEQYKTIIELSRQRNAGWLMITTDVQPNPYNELAINFESLINAINTPLTSAIVLQNRMASNSSLQSSGKIALDMPRSKVNLDLTKNTRAIMYKNIENTRNNELKIDVSYVGNLDTGYKDKGSSVKYKSNSNGVVLSATKNFNKITVGGAFGYQDSKID